MGAVDDLPACERLLAAERHLQHLAPGAVLVGGTAAALRAGHRQSHDEDPALEQSRALWNRSRLELRSEETLAQILDRGELAAWRELYRLARQDAGLRQRILRVVVSRVPLPYPRLWLAALASLGEPVDWGMDLPRYDPGV
jgi:hypothetical protein